METRYDWDPAKAQSNQRVHGVSFDAAVEIFSDPYIVVQEAENDGGENRFHAIGMTKSLVLLLVVYVDRSNPSVEVIRIITARKAEYYEQRAYEDQFR
jgi:uncharacterized DUF497 family protein